MHRMIKLGLSYLTLETENNMKTSLLIIFLFLCFYSFGQETNFNLDSSKNYNSGAPKREKYSNSYYGINSISNLGLNDRNLANQVAVRANCNDEGTIVVEIKVNKTGTVTNAKYSQKGSTTTSTCLQEVAIKSAYKYKWNEDSKAPENQIGFLVFNFRIAE